MKILLIAGHGGKDPGAVANGYKEAELTREFVLSLEKLLSEFAEVSVQDIQKDTYTLLKNGGKVPFSDYEYVLEIHFNAGGGIGTEIYVHETEKKTEVEERIVENIAKEGFVKRGVKKRADLLVMNTCKKQYGVSCALLEVCFIDAVSDMTRYEKKKQMVIQGVADAIIDGFGLRTVQKPVLLKEADEITWELNNRYFKISGYEDFIAVLAEAKKANSPLYWGYYKLVNNIKD